METAPTKHYKLTLTRYHRLLVGDFNIQTRQDRYGNAKRVAMVFRVTAGLTVYRHRVLTNIIGNVPAILGTIHEDFQSLFPLLEKPGPCVKPNDFDAEKRVNIILSASQGDRFWLVADDFLGYVEFATAAETGIVLRLNLLASVGVFLGTSIKPLPSHLCPERIEHKGD